ncbi:MAG: glycine cleavage system aminomethyltransferase GcvT, partial [Candidatus Binataceae bacterium]
LTNSAAQLKPGRAHYTLMCTGDGGTLDDLIVYRLDAERFMLCVNASNITADFAWLSQLNTGRAELRDVSDATALIAVQGPLAVAIVQRLSRAPLGEVPRFGVAVAEISGTRCIAARTGYTGEDGFELFVAAEDARRLFDAVLNEGVSDGVGPVGLGARDTLRLEAGLALYGHELDRTTTPVEAGLERFIRLGRGFIGEAALSEQMRTGPKKRLVGIATDDRKSIARQGYRLFRSGREAGVVTSGTYGPSFDRPLAMAYLNSADADGAGDLEAEIRTRRVQVSLMKLPFYRRAAAKGAEQGPGARSVAPTSRG